MNRDLTIVFKYAPFVLRDMGVDPSELVGFLIGRGFQIDQVLVNWSCLRGFRRTLLTVTTSTHRSPVIHLHA